MTTSSPAAHHSFQRLRERRLRAWRRALRRDDLPAPAVLALTERILRLQARQPQPLEGEPLGCWSHYTP